MMAGALTWSLGLGLVSSARSNSPSPSNGSRNRIPCSGFKTRQHCKICNIEIMLKINNKLKIFCYHLNTIYHLKQ